MNCPTSRRYASFETRFRIDTMTLTRRPFAFAVIAMLKCSGGLLAETSMALDRGRCALPDVAEPNLQRPDRPQGPNP